MKRRTGLGAGVLGLALLVGGAVWGVDRLDQADRTAGTRYWYAAGDRPAAEEPPTVPLSSLASLLLPMPAGYVPGPDAQGEAPDVAVSGELALARMKEQSTGLSATQRRERDRALDAMKLTGTAGRTYRAAMTGLTAEVSIARADGGSLKNLGQVVKLLFDATGDPGRKAPKVPGHPEAKCYPKTVVQGTGESKGERIDSLSCTAYTPGTLVTFRASWGKESGTREAWAQQADVKDAVELLRKQLDHLKSPGESV